MTTLSILTHALTCTQVYLVPKTQQKNTQFWRVSLQKPSKIGLFQKTAVESETVAISSETNAALVTGVFSKESSTRLSGPISEVLDCRHNEEVDTHLWSPLLEGITVCFKRGT